MNCKIITPAALAFCLSLMFSLPANAQFNNPNGILFDNEAHLWLANYGDNNVLELGIGNCTATILNTITNGINGPTRLAFDSSGHLWVTNTSSNTITVYDDLGSAGGKLIKTISNAAIQHPLGIAVDAYGDFYVANNTQSNIATFNINDGLVETLTQDNSGFPFLDPGVLVIYGQNIYAGLGPCSLENSKASCDNAVISYNVGEFLTGDPQEVIKYAAPGQTGPTGVTFDNQGFVYVSYYTTPSWVVYTPKGKKKLEVQDGVGGPEGIQLDSSGNVYVSNSRLNTITEYSPYPSGKLICTIRSALHN
jgi:streptogramin lyase